MKATQLKIDNSNSEEASEKALETVGFTLIADQSERGKGKLLDGTHQLLQTFQKVYPEIAVSRNESLGTIMVTGINSLHYQELLKTCKLATLLPNTLKSFLLEAQQTQAAKTRADQTAQAMRAALKKEQQPRPIPPPRTTSFSPSGIFGSPAPGHQEPIPPPRKQATPKQRHEGSVGG